MQLENFEFAEAQPEFTHLSEEEVWAAMDRDDDNKIACEVTRLICCFWKKFMRIAKKYQNIPPEIMHVSVCCPIERVAVVALIGYVRSETGSAASVMLH